jgi:hypothetical protein
MKGVVINTNIRGYPHQSKAMQHSVEVRSLAIRLAGV